MGISSPMFDGCLARSVHIEAIVWMMVEWKDGFPKHQTTPYYVFLKHFVVCSMYNLCINKSDLLLLIIIISQISINVIISTLFTESFSFCTSIFLTHLAAQTVN